MTILIRIIYISIQLLQF